MLRKLLELKEVLQEEHKRSLLSDPSMTIEAVRYSQGYLNALDRIDQEIDMLAKEEQKDDIEDEQ